MLAQLGFLKEAEQEFVIALRQANADAAHNLNLCRSLTASLRQDYKISRIDGEPQKKKIQSSIFSLPARKSSLKAEL